MILQLTIRPRWWLRHYVCAVALAAWLTGREPDMARVGCWIERGLSVRVVRVRSWLEA